MEVYVKITGTLSYSKLLPLYYLVLLKLLNYSIFSVNNESCSSPVCVVFAFYDF